MSTSRIRTLLLPERLKIRAADTTCGACEERVRGCPSKCPHFGKIAHTTQGWGHKRHADCLMAEERD